VHLLLKNQWKLTLDFSILTGVKIKELTNNLGVNILVTHSTFCFGRTTQWALECASDSSSSWALPGTEARMCARPSHGTYCLLAPGPALSWAACLPWSPFELPWMTLVKKQTPRVQNSSEYAYQIVLSCILNKSKSRTLENYAIQ